MLPSSSLAMTYRPPGTEKSIDDSRFSTSVMCWLISYRSPKLTVRLSRGRQSSWAYMWSQVVLASSLPRPPTPERPATGYPSKKSARALPLNCPVYVNAPRAVSGFSGLNRR